MFKEITIPPPELPDSIRRLTEKRSQLAQNDIPAIAQALENVLDKIWKPEFFHLIPHSSGYDSRIISYIVMKLRNRYGRKWLGDVLFFCRFPEVKEFRQIMEFQGWDKGQYTYQERDELENAVDFDRCWMWIDDYQFAVFTEPYSLYISGLVQSGKITQPLSKVQYISGTLGNEVFRFQPKYLIERFYYGLSITTVAHAEYGEIIAPFASYDVLRLIKPVDIGLTDTMAGKVGNILNSNSLLYKMKSPLSTSLRTYKRICSRLGLDADVHRVQKHIDIRKALLEYLSPELLRLEKAPDEGPHEQRRQLSDKLRETCLESFTGSWYYRNVVQPGHVQHNLDVPKILWHNDWWNEYARAAICEELIRRGVEIML
jgi:hypothetical protein